jgi:erythromycin esterase
VPRLDVYDRRDWEFLREVVGDRRIAMLGESNHCVEEYSQAKFNMIRYLHEELGFDVVAFESYMLPAHLSDVDLADGGSAESATASIYSMWNTPTVKNLLSYVKATKSSERPMHIAGIDMKIEPDEWQREAAFVHTVIERDTALAALYLRAQATFGPDIIDRFRRGEVKSSEPLATKFADFYNALPSEIESAYSQGSLMGTSAIDVSFACQIARILAAQPLYYDAKTVKRVALRDSLMARNVEYLAEEMYRDQRIIVWAHNGHIARARSEAVLSDLTFFGMGPLAERLSRIKWAGEYVNDRYGNDVYVIGLQMASGHYKTIGGREQRVRPLRRDSVEYLLRDTTVAASFLDFTRSTDPVGSRWQSSRSKVLLEAYWYDIVPDRQYDGVLVISTATPSGK